MNDPIVCSKRLELTALSRFPIVRPGDDIAELVLEGLRGEQIQLCRSDVLVVASKVISRAEGRFVDLGALSVSEKARKLAAALGMDARLVEVVLQESLEISRTAPGILITRNRHGVVCANAGVDLSNAHPGITDAGSGPWALRLPEQPDVSAERLQRALTERTGAAVGVVISDSVGRPFRIGSIAVAVGAAGVPPLFDQRGSADLFGMRLEHTVTALADQLATAADLVLGQGAEGRAVVHVRGIDFRVGLHSAKELVRSSELDLYAGLPPPKGESL
jgi:coenzyme F420-0:L-glutamate ligase/coenzyme F420-1:gamma-L-glutamate ligase